MIVSEPTEPIFEFDRITDQVFIGTNACCAVHFEKHLLKEGVTADISMEGERIDHPYGIDTFLWLPTDDHEPPSLQNVEVGIDVLDRIISQGRKAYIHCKNGHGRAPTFYAAYLIKKQGMDPDAAVALIKERRPSIHIEDVQIAFLKTLV